MRLEIEKAAETKDWSNKYFQPKYLLLTLKDETKRPGELKIYFADKALIFEKNLFEGLPYLSFKADPKGTLDKFKLMPSIALERRYAFYYIKPDISDLVDYAYLQHT